MITEIIINFKESISNGRYPENNSKEFKITNEDCENLRIIYNLVPDFTTVSFTNKCKENVERHFNKDIIHNISVFYKD